MFWVQLGDFPLFTETETIRKGFPLGAQEAGQACSCLQEAAGGEGGGEQAEDEGVPEEAARGEEEAARGGPAGRRLSHGLHGGTAQAAGRYERRLMLFVMVQYLTQSILQIEYFESIWRLNGIS